MQARACKSGKKSEAGRKQDGGCRGGRWGGGVDRDGLPVPSPARESVRPAHLLIDDRHYGFELLRRQGGERFQDRR